MWHLFRLFPATPLFAVEDGRGGSGTDDDEQDPGAQGADPSDEGSSGEAADGDDADPLSADEDDDEALILGDERADGADTRSADERLNALSRHNRKLRKQVVKNLPLTRLLKSTGISADQLGDVLAKARNYDALVSGAPESKRLIQQLLGDDGTGSPSQKTREKAGEMADELETMLADLKDEDIPFNINEPSGKFLANEARLSRTVLKKFLGRLRDLEGGVKRSEETASSLKLDRERERVTGLQREWTSAMNAAAEKIKEKGVRTLFKDALIGAFSRYGGKVPVTKVIGHYLKELGINPTQAAMARGAAQQRLAEQNSRRPGHQAGGPGSATPARNKGFKTLADVHKHVRTSVS